VKNPDKNRSRLMVACATAALAAIAAASARAANPEPSIPTLLPGGQAVAKGTHVNCQVTASTVLCTEAGGLSATLSTTGATRVAKGAAPVQPSGKVMKLAANGGFVILGTNGNSIYCHVYVEGGRILSCAVNGGHDPGDRGFDISDRSIVLFRFDAAGMRHDLKTYRQP
jgi:hypothetical protein